MPAVRGVWYYCLTGLVCFCLPPPPLSTSAAINKGAHRPVATTCVARRGCGALTRHRVPWACSVIVRAVKSGSPAVPAPAPPVPILNLIVFLKLHRCAITYMITQAGAVAVHACAGLAC